MKNPYRAVGTFTGEAYVERDADRALLNEISENSRYPYVLAPRQSGKSSLITHVMGLLRPPTYHCLFVDIQGIRRGASDSYREFLLAWSSELLHDVKPPLIGEFPDPKETLKRLLSVHKGRVVVFLDEIDYLRGVDFKDDFFGLIRSFYNQRAVDPHSGFDRLQFVLSGAAQPSELIEKTNHSPFNVGVPIVLGDLTVAEINALLKPMKRQFTVHPGAARRLHAHTGGSVYLTQLLLERTWTRRASQFSERLAPSEIDDVASDIVATAASDIHFVNIYRAVSEFGNHLEAFRRLMNGENIDLVEVKYLEMAGLIAPEKAIRNSIYERVFGEGGALQLSFVAPREIPPEVDLDALFTIKGAITPEKHYLFSGREDLIARCLADIRSDGSALVIFGERGVGKTSLGWQLAGLLSSGSQREPKQRALSKKSGRDDAFHCIWCTCSDLITNIEDLLFTILNDTETTFSFRALFPALLQDHQLVRRFEGKYKLGSLLTSLSAKKGRAFLRTPSVAAELNKPDELSALLAFKALFDNAIEMYPAKRGIVIFLDEFDQVQDKTKLGLLLKALNNVRFVIIGVASSRAALLGHHPSVGRKITSYEVPLFALQDVNVFFDKVESRSGRAVVFTSDFRARVFAASSGFPWVIQQLGYYCISQVSTAGGEPSHFPLVMNGDALSKALPEFLRSKLGGEGLELGKLGATARKILLALARSTKGRLSDDSLVFQLPERERPWFENAVVELHEAGLVYSHKGEVRLSDPLTKILIELSTEYGLIENS